MAQQPQAVALFLCLNVMEKVTQSNSVSRRIAESDSVGPRKPCLLAETAGTARSQMEFGNEEELSLLVPKFHLGTCQYHRFHTPGTANDYLIRISLFLVDDR